MERKGTHHYKANEYPTTVFWVVMYPLVSLIINKQTVSPGFKCSVIPRILDSNWRFLIV